MPNIKSNPDLAVIETDELPHSIPPLSQVDMPTQKTQLSRSSFSFPNLFRIWGNFSLRSKLSLLFILSTAIPIVVVTQVLTSISEDRLLSDLRESVQEKGTVFVDEYVLWTKEEAKVDAGALVRLVEGEEIDLNNPQAVASRSKVLEPFLRINDDGTPKLIESFKILTNSQGQTVAQSIQVLEDDFSKPPKLPVAKDYVTLQKYRSVSLPLGIPLGDVLIVQNALKTEKPLAGIELLKSSSLQRLGLDKQADVGLRSQVTQGLSAAKAPAPEGTYDIEAGKIGMVSMAVYPIKVKGRLVGTAIVGTLMNRNYGLTDRMTSKYKDINVATIFAQDLRVATNVPYVDPQTKAIDNTRAISTRVASEVAATIAKGQSFVGKTNVAGLDYLTTYLPLYDHQKELNPQAKPIGNAFVAKPLAEVNNTLRQQKIAGYGIGGGILLLAAAIAFPITGTFSRRLRRLADYAQRIKFGEQGVKIEATEQQDEIGQLSSSLSSLLDQLAINEELRRQEVITTERLQQASEAQQESEFLQADVNHILDVVVAVEEGDLTVQADVSDRVTGLVSDTLNRLIEQLGGTLSQVLRTAQQVTDGAKNLENMNAIVAGNSGEQSQSITDVLTLTENVEKIARESSENVVKSNQSLLSARSAVEKGQISMSSLTDGFEVLQQGIGDISKRTEELQAFINLADQFAQEQSQVASMTQMLSLSADQLGARALAQDDPKEFRMSALEFKAIANQISELSKQAFTGVSSLKQRSEGVHTLVSGVNKEVRDLASLVASFDEIVTQSIQAFNNVQDTTEQVVQVGNTVEQSSQKIVATSQSTAQAMRNIAQLAERTAQLTQTTQTQSEQMGNLSNQLLKSIQFFRLPALEKNVLDIETAEVSDEKLQGTESFSQLESSASLI
jgi:methyl-accepting chemotaxis protein